MWSVAKCFGLAKLFMYVSGLRSVWVYICLLYRKTQTIKQKKKRRTPSETNGKSIQCQGQRLPIHVQTFVQCTYSAASTCAYCVRFHLQRVIAAVNSKSGENAEMNIWRWQWCILARSSSCGLTRFCRFTERRMRNKLEFVEVESVKWIPLAYGNENGFPTFDSDVCPMIHENFASLQRES